jgi:L-ornithine N5-oxygenase
MSDGPNNEVHDLVGIGFGPAAIAVAAAFEDGYENLPPGGERLRMSYLERAPSSAWQPDLLLPGADIQHHWLRDYANPRNPRSRFSFPNYLKETGRFYQFTLLGNYVTRIEWSEYTEWTARQLDQDVRYNAEVHEIAPCLEGGRVTMARVRYRDTETGTMHERLTRNVMVSIGFEPSVPEVFQPHLGERIFHANEYLTRIKRFPVDEPLRIAVVGAGQTAGEIFLHLVQRFPHAQLYSLVRHSGIRLYNLCHFSNENYFPEESDYCYGLDRERRQHVLDELYATNYAAVDPELSTAWYRTVYEDKFFGPGRIHMHKRVDVESVVPATDVRLTLREVNIGTTEDLDVDIVILATGYRRQEKLPQMLGRIVPFIVFDDAGYPEISKAYRVETTADCDVSIYLNGLTEWRHGINSAMVHSIMAERAERITEDIKAHYKTPTSRRSNFTEECHATSEL